MCRLGISIIVVTIIMLAGIGEWLGVEMFHSEEIAKNLAIILFWASLLLLAPPIGECLKALRIPGWGAALDNSVSSFIALTIFSVLLFIGQSISLQNILIISSTAVCVVLIVLFRKLTIVGKIFQRGPPCITIWQVYIEAYPVFLINLSTYIAANASIWVVGFYLSHEHVAIYGVVLKLFNLIAVPLLIINLAIEPSIAEYIHENKRKHLDALLRLSATAALVSTSLISAIIFIWGDWVLTILFGNEFISGYTTLKILVIGNIVNVWTGSCASMMLLGGHQKILMLNRLLFGVASILISFILVTPYGIEGVALAVSVSLAISNVVAWWIVKNKMRYDTSATLDIKNRIFILGH